MGLWIALVGTIGLLTAGTREMSAQTKPDESVVGRIAVNAKGTVSFDGTVITINVLKEKLSDLKKRNGVVWYYREAPKGEPPPQAMQVIKLVIDSQVPISMSTKPDFSDVLLPDGTTQPRAGVRKR